MSNDFTVKNKSVKVLLHRWLCWVASQWLPADWRLACLFIMHHQRWIRWKAYDGTETALIKSHRNYILPDLNTLSNYLTSSFHPFHLLSSTPKSLSSFFFLNLARKWVSWDFPEVSAHGNVSLLQIGLEMRKDMNQKREELGNPFITLNLTPTLSDYLEKQDQNKLHVPKADKTLYYPWQVQLTSARFT